MNSTKGTQLVLDFTKSLNSLEDTSVIHSNISRNIFEWNSLHTNCLLYIKGRAESPYKWGVTSNVIKRLQEQQKNWFVVLLFETYQKGYVLSSLDVEYYIRNNIWPLGRDGDYKPASGTYLARNKILYTTKEFTQIFENT